MTIKAYILAAYYRFCVKYMPKEKLEKKMGIRDQESPVEETEENYKKIKLIAFHVNRITTHTPWESKCLVRALTLRRILLRDRINCTLYLGVKLENGKMAAHAWIRTGTLFPTGGTGKGYTVVAKFCSYVDSREG